MDTTQETHSEPQTMDDATQVAREQNTHAQSVMSRVIFRVEKSFERGGDSLWSALKKRPLLGVGVVSVGGMLLAALIGASELAVGLGAGVAAYQILKKHEPPSKALEDAARFGL